VVAADSSSAILNEEFDPLYLISSASTLVVSPYREAEESIVEPIKVDTKNGHDLVVHEAELCRTLLTRVKADVVHLDMSLGSAPVEQLSPITFSNMRISSMARQRLIKILPKLRKIACEITQKYGIETLAIGKESIPVRIAELTSGAQAVIYACNKAIKEEHPLFLGLPAKCQPLISENEVTLQSLLPAEHDVRGLAQDCDGFLEKVNIIEKVNPVARGFRTLKITAKKE
jgi:hypothetical protein